MNLISLGNPGTYIDFVPHSIENVVCYIDN